MVIRRIENFLEAFEKKFRRSRQNWLMVRQKHEILQPFPFFGHISLQTYTISWIWRALDSADLGEQFSYSKNIMQVLQNFFRCIWSKNFSSKNFLRKNLKRNFVENFSGFTKTFGSKSVETFFSKWLKKFSNRRMTLIFSFRHPLNLIV